MPHTDIFTPIYEAGITKLITAIFISGMAKASYIVTPLFGAAPTSAVCKFVFCKQNKCQKFLKMKNVFDNNFENF